MLNLTYNAIDRLISNINFNIKYFFRKIRNMDDINSFSLLTVKNDLQKSSFLKSNITKVSEIDEYKKSIEKYENEIRNTINDSSYIEIQNKNNVYIQKQLLKAIKYNENKTTYLKNITVKIISIRVYNKLYKNNRIMSKINPKNRKRQNNQKLKQKCFMLKSLNNRISQNCKVI